MGSEGLEPTTVTLFPVLEEEWFSQKERFVRLTADLYS
jgi:hypothetical protein